MNKAAEKYVSRAWYLLKYGYGILMILAGLDKFFGYLTQWVKFLSPFLANKLPVSPVHLMYDLGLLEIIIGILLLTKFTKWGAYLLAIFLIIVGINFLSMNLHYFASQNFALSIGALTLAWLTEALCESKAPSKS